MHPLFHQLYIDYCTYFNGNQDYFECHEVLEEYWKEIAPRERMHPLVGYIQIATGMYHWRRGNINGARRMLEKGYFIIKGEQQSIFFEKINIIDFLNQIEKSILSIKKNDKFRPFTIQIIDSKLQQFVQQKITTLPKLEQHFLENKHILRNRESIIALRLHNLDKKHNS